MEKFEVIYDAEANEFRPRTLCATFDHEGHSYSISATVENGVVVLGELKVARQGRYRINWAHVQSGPKRSRIEALVLAQFNTPAKFAGELEARECAAQNVKGFPAWRITVLADAYFGIQLRPGEGWFLSILGLPVEVA